MILQDVVTLPGQEGQQVNQSSGSVYVTSSTTTSPANDAPPSHSSNPLSRTTTSSHNVDIAVPQSASQYVLRLQQHEQEILNILREDRENRAAAELLTSEGVQNTQDTEENANASNSGHQYIDHSAGSSTRGHHPPDANIDVSLDTNRDSAIPYPVALYSHFHSNDRYANHTSNGPQHIVNELDMGSVGDEEHNVQNSDSDGNSQSHVPANIL